MKPADSNSMTLAQLGDWFVDQGQQSFRGGQVFRWLHGQLVTEIEQMTDLSKGLRIQLAQWAALRSCEILEEQVADDGTRKYRFGLYDGQEIEGVWMPSESRRTLCISTQVGCAMGCDFCATGTMGLIRNLSAGEIVGQVEAVVRQLRSDRLRRPVSNVVFMGMGEPLANLDSVCSAVDILCSDTGSNISRRHITVSTVGLPGAMEKFVHRVPVKLAVSLNATTDEVRDRIMPINKRHPLEKLIATCRNLPLAGKDRITFEYVLLAGVNDSDDDARRLARLLDRVRAKINLIPYNPFAGLPYERPSSRRVLSFQQTLIDAGYSVFVRQSRGQNLQAACGQLVAQRRKDPSACS